MTHTFNRQSGTDTDTWTIYLPEYDNLSNATDYSFIRVKINGEEYEIYFANYEDGEAESTADYDVFRNYLYRFRVKVFGNFTISVSVNEWEDLFNNEYTF